MKDIQSGKGGKSGGSKPPGSLRFFKLGETKNVVIPEFMKWELNMFDRGDAMGNLKSVWGKEKKD